MQGSRVRRPPTWRVLFLFVLALAAAAACRMPSSAPAAGSGTSEAAEKTKRMEEKSAEIEKHAEAVRTMEGTDQEKIDAMNSLDQERRELNDMDQGK